MANSRLIRPCPVANCERQIHAGGYCNVHYLRLRRNGAVDKVKVKKTCSIEGCSKIAQARGWCAMHWKRWSQYGDPMVVLRPVSDPYAGATCQYCSRPAQKRGFCAAHYRRWRVHGNPLIAKRVGNRVLHDWILAHVSYEGDECLIWPFPRDKSGYGHAQFKGKRHTANYFMCTYAHGAPPSPEHESAHRCGNGHLGCVNPKHLYWATRQQNIADIAKHGRQMRGSRHYNTNLTEEDVLKIRDLRGKMFQKQIGVMFGITEDAVGSIHRRETWAWLE